MDTSTQMSPLENDPVVQWEDARVWRPSPIKKKQVSRAVLGLPDRGLNLILSQRTLELLPNVGYSSEKRITMGNKVFVTENAMKIVKTCKECVSTYQDGSYFKVRLSSYKLKSKTGIFPYTLAGKLFGRMRFSCQAVHFKWTTQSCFYRAWIFSDLPQSTTFRKIKLTVKPKGTLNMLLAILGQGILFLPKEDSLLPKSKVQPLHILSWKIFILKG